MRFWWRRDTSERRDPRPSVPPRRDMVEWYAPKLWLSTGVQVFISTVLGQRFDYRTMEDTAGDQGVFTYAAWEATKEPFFFDYLADTGDGWNSTHAVAALVAQEELLVGNERLPRGSFLLLGGDEVYPSASKQNYRERLVAPFEAALERADPAGPDLFAVPGNHDWYDGLVSFSRLFRPDGQVGGWHTKQRRSYFAVHLPYGWWLWAVDIQLEADIDPGQLEYFSKIGTKELQRGDRVILASAEPDWLYGNIKDPTIESNLALLEERIITPREATVHVWVAGDLHHYRRHQRVDDADFHRIVCGGGGAYLTPTHQSMYGPAGNVARRTVEVGAERFEQQRAFPSPTTSWRLSLLNAFFLVKNWKLGLVTGIVYSSATWLHPEKQINLHDFLSDGGRLLWGLLVFAAASFLTYRSGDGKDGRTFRLFGGMAHAACHIALALFIAYRTARVCHGFFTTALYGFLAQVALNFLGGAVLGTTLLGLYLLTASNVFGAHMDEAFSALRIQDFKSFLRFRIQPDGGLEIFPIGIPRVPRKGEVRAEYLLIEGPITVPQKDGAGASTA